MASQQTDWPGQFEKDMHILCAWTLQSWTKNCISHIYRMDFESAASSGREMLSISLSPANMQPVLTEHTIHVLLTGWYTLTFSFLEQKRLEGSDAEMKFDTENTVLDEDLYKHFERSIKSINSSNKDKGFLLQGALLISRAEAELCVASTSDDFDRISKLIVETSVHITKIQAKHGPVRFGIRQLFMRTGRANCLCSLYFGKDLEKALIELNDWNYWADLSVEHAHLVDRALCKIYRGIIWQKMNKLKDAKTEFAKVRKQLAVFLPKTNATMAWLGDELRLLIAMQSGSSAPGSLTSLLKVGTSNAECTGESITANGLKSSNGQKCNAGNQNQTSKFEPIPDFSPTDFVSTFKKLLQSLEMQLRQSKTGPMSTNQRKRLVQKVETLATHCALLNHASR
eukprot:747842_1